MKMVANAAHLRKRRKRSSEVTRFLPNGRQTESYPETGFEEKSIQPRKPAGQMNEIRLTAQVAGSRGAVVACEILCSCFVADHHVSFAAS